MTGNDDLFGNIQKITMQLEKTLSDSGKINQDAFYRQSSNYSKELKKILRNYHEISDKEEKHSYTSHINYYRQLQHYLIFMVRYPTILTVPNHSEIQQTLQFIQKKDELIQNIYIRMSKKQQDLFHGNFKHKLEDFFDRKNQKEKNNPQNTSS